MIGFLYESFWVIQEVKGFWLIQEKHDERIFGIRDDERNFSGFQCAAAKGLERKR
jgi:hypothetical protein